MIIRDKISTELAKTKFPRHLIVEVATLFTKTIERIQEDHSRMGELVVAQEKVEKMLTKQIYKELNADSKAIWDEIVKHFKDIHSQSKTEVLTQAYQCFRKEFSAKLAEYLKGDDVADTGKVAKDLAAIINSLIGNTLSDAELGVLRHSVIRRTIDDSIGSYSALLDDILEPIFEKELADLAEEIEEGKMEMAIAELEQELEAEALSDEIGKRALTAIEREQALIEREQALIEREAKVRQEELEHFVVETSEIEQAERVRHEASETANLTEAAAPVENAFSNKVEKLILPRGLDLNGFFNQAHANESQDVERRVGEDNSGPNLEAN